MRIADNKQYWVEQYLCVWNVSRGYGAGFKGVRHRLKGGMAYAGGGGLNGQGHNGALALKLVKSSSQIKQQQACHTASIKADAVGHTWKVMLLTLTPPVSYVKVGRLLGDLLDMVHVLQVRVHEGRALLGDALGASALVSQLFTPAFPR